MEDEGECGKGVWGGGGEGGIRVEEWFFFRAEDGIRDLVRSRGLGDVYRRQATSRAWGSRTHVASRLDTCTPAVPMEYPDRCNACRVHC